MESSWGTPYNRYMRKFAGLGLALGSLAFSLFLAEAICKLAFNRPLTGPLFQHDPILVHRNYPNLDTSQVFDGRRTSIYTDAMGHRRPGFRLDPPKRDSIHVLWLGDSFTFGTGVAAEEGFVQLLENSARNLDPDIRFANAAVGGYETQHEVGYYEAYAQNEKADLVVLVIGPNDVQGNYPLFVYEINNGDLRFPSHRANPNTNVWLKNFANSFPLYGFLSSHSYFFSVLRYAIAASYVRKPPGLENDKPVAAQATLAPPPKTEEPSNRMTKLLIRRLATLAKERGASLLVTNCGSQIAYGTTLPFLKDAPAWFKQEGIDYIDVSDQINDPGSSEPLTFVSDGHYNVYGNQRFAHAFWPHLERRLLALRRPETVAQIR